jgi:hypothetical protein
MTAKYSQSMKIFCASVLAPAASCECQKIQVMLRVGSFKTRYVQNDQKK